MRIFIIIITILRRQAEFLQEAGAVFQTISGIDQWWIGLTNSGNAICINCLLNKDFLSN